MQNCCVLPSLSCSDQKPILHRHGVVVELNALSGHSRQPTGTPSKALYSTVSLVSTVTFETVLAQVEVMFLTH